MTYKLSFHPDAQAEWRKLDATVNWQFKKKLAERNAVYRVAAKR